MFVNKDKKSYELEYVINSIKNDKNYRCGYHNCLDFYNDDDWCNQFTSQLFKEFEIISVRNVGGMKDGFYIVDRNYTKFINSSFIIKKSSKKLFESLLKGQFSLINKDKSIDKYFVKYIKDNTIKHYTYDDFIEEFNPNKHTPSNNRYYQPHTNSPHTVNGFWRNQPYGSRSNPQYKMIWIDSFERGSKKVG
ncbi:hypothetical protein CPG37_10875 [Malaciobacter canalis]|uniref:Restriction endonuclease n=1 Tax=Malaciobacter canalis TaxID=1912871 RepID=A0ABX4LN21_9BACT|nr:hypothetical protein [Malaciobacter canalis]PHO09093.1 hypothetical protein CPG37_10875 [Malaciobacter canalis]QEE31803.1 hypothetical protein ACAN_0292 [Malaciobacter canalis]